jgi:hypothetical protein
MKGSIRWQSGLVTGAILVVGAPIVRGAPEYLEAREPISGALEDAPSATEGIGQDASQPFKWERRRPSRHLQEWRNRLIPETGNPFVDDMQFFLRPRFYYFHRDFDPGTPMETAAAGGSISVETGWWRDRIRLGLTGYGSFKLHGPADKDGLGILQPGQKSYTSLGEAYMAVKFDETNIRVGRSRVNIPYINDHDIRMTPNTFEGFGFSSLMVPKLPFQMAHISKIKRRNAGSFQSMSQHAGVFGEDRGVSVVSARYNFGDNSFVSASEQYGWDMYNTFYAEAEHLMELGGDFKLRLGVQFTDQRSVGDDLLGNFSTQQSGIELALEYLGVIGALSYTWTADGSGIRNPWGGTPTYHSMMISDFDRAGEQSVRAGLSYDFGCIGFIHVMARPDIGAGKCFCHVGVEPVTHGDEA